MLLHHLRAGVACVTKHTLRLAHVWPSTLWPKSSRLRSQDSPNQVARSPLRDVGSLLQPVPKSPTGKVLGVDAGGADVADELDHEVPCGIGLLAQALAVPWEEGPTAGSDLLIGELAALGNEPRDRNIV